MRVTNLYAISYVSEVKINNDAFYFISAQKVSK